MGVRSNSPPPSRPTHPSRRRTRTASYFARIPRPQTATYPSSVYVWLTFLLLLLLIRHRLILRPTPHLYPGIPPSTLSVPHGAPTFPQAYFGVNARFLFYTANYGQFNNQLVSLINALFIARRTDAVLVLPYAKLGKESSWDLARAGLHDELYAPRELVGDYFNYSHLLITEHVVRPTQFFASRDGEQLLTRSNITVNYRSGNAFRKLFAHPSADVLRRLGRAVEVLSPQHNKTPLANYCDFHPDSTLASVADLGRNGRFTFLPIVFRRHSLNCTFEEPDWVSIRRSLLPRDEFLHAVDGFMQALERPIMAVHLRVFLNGDLGNFSARSFVDMLFRDFEPQLMRARTLFIAYSPSSGVSREAFAILRERFHGKVADGATTTRYFREEDVAFAGLALTNVLLDMWICVKSEVFLGRLGSSLSWNAVFWRQALAGEDGLDTEVVRNPLWYSLSNLTTTGAERYEGPLLGANLRHVR